MNKILLTSLFFLLVSVLATTGIPLQNVHAQDDHAPTPTSTYMPLAEPFVPENPSELELGRNWFWHHCMPCHGDLGQGLTDEFREIWPEDHQNCWGRGCHGGRVDDLGFPIPTVVPPLVSNIQLAQFSSRQTLYEYLKATHPPQSPGYLDDEIYQAVSLYVFKINDRPLEEPTPISTATLNPTLTSTPDVLLAEKTPLQSTILFYIGLGIILILAVIWGIQKGCSPTEHAK